MDFNFDTGTISGGIQTIDPSGLPPLGGQSGVLTIAGSGAILLSNGTTAERPAISMPAMLRYNTDTSSLECYTGASWSTLSIGGGTVTSVSVTGSTGLTVGGSPITSSGTITLTLSTELQGLSALSTNGIIVRTTSGTYTSRTITGTGGDISVSNGDGISGNPTIDLVDTGTPVSASFVKITTDTKGRTTATTPVITSDITSLVDGTYVNISGDSMQSGANLTFSGSGEVLGLPTSPSGDTAATSKAYVDSLVNGLTWKPPARVATTLNITLSGLQTIDSVSVLSNDRVLVKNQTLSQNNGIYVASSGVWIRATDFDGTPISEVNGAAVFVEEGTSQSDTGWVQTATVVTIGTDPMIFVQFSAAGSYQAGTGLTLTGNIFSITAPVSPALGGTGTITAPSAGQILIGTSGSVYTPATLSSGTGISINSASGSITINNTGVTSVALSAPASILTVSGSPVTTTGTLTLTLATQSANTVFAGPTSGGATQPTFRALTVADLPIYLYRESASGQITPVASGTNSVAIGSASTSTATESFSVGSGTNARIFGQKAYANGSFASAGDAQHGIYVLRNETTNSVATALFLDGSAGLQRLVIPNNSVVSFTITVSARRTDAIGGGAGYLFTGTVRKDTTSGSITFIGNPAKTVLGETDNGWDTILTANTTNGDLRITVTGQNAKTIRWVATVMTVEVTN
jgi:hypothetical protein